MWRYVILYLSQMTTNCTLNTWLDCDFDWRATQSLCCFLITISITFVWHYEYNTIVYWYDSMFVFFKCFILFEIVDKLVVLSRNNCILKNKFFLAVYLFHELMYLKMMGVNRGKSFKILITLRNEVKSWNFYTLKSYLKKFPRFLENAGFPETCLKQLKFASDLGQLPEDW